MTKTSRSSEWDESLRLTLRLIMLRSSQVRCSILLAAVLIVEVRAQTTSTGGLNGVVTDQTGAVMPSARVVISDSNKGTEQTTITDSQGTYRFSFLLPGRYELVVNRDGFRQEKRIVDVVLGPTVSLNVSLVLAATSSEVTVTSKAPTIQAENGDVSATMNSRQVSEVPNPGNDLTYIAQTAPGVVMNTDGGFGSKFSILGMPGFSYAFTVDGVSITENTLNIVRGGPLGLTLGANQVQEATVVTTGYSSQFGKAAGGNVNYVTKSGGNAFHGNAQYYWNGTVLNANDWFNQAVGNPRPLSIANQWAASLGGPVRKDSLFFFFDTEGLRLLIPQILFTVIPTPEFEAATIANIDSKFGANSASDAFYKQIFRLYDGTPRASKARDGGFSPIDPSGCTGFVGPNNLGTTQACARNVTNTRSRPSQDTLTSGRLDWNIGENDRAFLRVQEEGGLSAQSDDPISSVFDSDYDNSRWQAEVLETHAFNPTTANQFLVGLSDHYWANKSSHPTQSLAAFPALLNFSVPGTFTNLGGLNADGFYRFDTRVLEIAEDVATTHGSHKVGLGLSLDRERWREHSTIDAAGTLFPQTLRAFYEGGFDSASPEDDFTTLTQAFTSQPDVSVRLGGIQAYVQDDWRARKNLSLTIGLRAEHRANFRCENRCFARLVAPFEEIIHDPNQPYNQMLLNNQKHALFGLDPIDWSPRFGFAWQPLGVSYNSVLRGGIGIFYDPFQEAIAQVFWLNPPNYNSFAAFDNNLTPGEANSLFRETTNSNQAFIQGYKTGENLAQLQVDIPNFIPPALTGTSERKMHRPQYQRWSIEWQQGIGTKTSVSLGYFGHHGIHELVQNPNANAYDFGSLPAAQCSTPPVPPCSDPRFGEVVEWASRAISNYHGLVASFRREFQGWGNGLVQVNYTFGHALDEVSNNGIWSFTQGTSNSPQDPSNLRGAYGPAEYDVRHSMNANYVWELPVKSLLRGHGPGALLTGWQVSGTFFARTGFPYSVFDFALSGSLQHQNNYFGTIYAVPAGPLPSHSSCGRSAAFSLNEQPCLPPQYLVQNGSTVPNPNALFIQANCETDFNAGHLPPPTDPSNDPCGGRLVSLAQGRNRFRGPGYFNADLAVMKKTKIPGWENSSLALGVQFFNVLNHPNFGFPDNAVSSPTFGVIFHGEQTPNGLLGVGNNGSSRMIQLKAELKF
jgi:Carboxypeptidase regulatory-like domain